MATTANDDPNPPTWAESAVRGAICSCCSAIFSDEHGHPVLCRPCWGTWGEVAAEEAGLQRSDHEEVSI